MLKLLSLKKQDQEQKAAAAEGGQGKQVVSAARRRLQKDLSSENLENPWCEIRFPNADDLMHFIVVIKPDEGYWKGGQFSFSFEISADYPYSAPKVLCTTKVYHPNIDTDGKVCLNILREDWKPVLDINAVVTGLLFLFLEPNPDDPLNKEAADLLQTNKYAFSQNVIRVMRGFR